MTGIAVRAAGIVTVIAVLAVAATARDGTLSALDREFTGIAARAAETVVRVEPGVSGVCISDKGHILTHSGIEQFMVDQNRSTVQVQFGDRRRYDASLVASDPTSKTAMLLIDARRRFRCAQVGRGGDLRVGNFVLSIGNPFDTAAESAPAVTLGVVSAAHRDAQGSVLRFETSAATNPGQQGSPFFDVEGNLVGVTLDLPNGQDLATLTPIERIRERYASLLGDPSVFEDAPLGGSTRSGGRALSAAFAIAAARARPAVCTLMIRRPSDEGLASDSEDKGADSPSPTAPRRDGPISAAIVDPGAGFAIAPLFAFDREVEAIDATLHDGRRATARVIARDHKAGLALIGIDAPANAPLPGVDDAPRGERRIGQFVIAVGAPHEQPDDGLVTVGILSATRQLDSYRDALQTDAGVNVKNAGGLLVDLRGRALGVILPPAAPFGQNSGLGFVMPMEAVRRAVTTLSTGHDVKRAYLGVFLSDSSDPAGVRIDRVEASQAADRAGLREGDVITHLDDSRVASRDALAEYLLLYRSAGEELRVRLQRDGATEERTLLLGDRDGG